MIILLGIIDLITVLLSYSAINYNIYTTIAVIFLIILGLKGLWTVSVSNGSIFLLLGLLDAATATVSILSIQYNLFNSIAVILLTLTGLKSVLSMIR